MPRGWTPTLFYILPSQRVGRCTACTCGDLDGSCGAVRRQLCVPCVRLAESLWVPALALSMCACVWQAVTLLKGMADTPAPFTPKEAGASKHSCPCTMHPSAAGGTRLLHSINSSPAAAGGRASAAMHHARELARLTGHSSAASVARCIGTAGVSCGRLRVLVAALIHHPSMHYP